VTDVQQKAEDSLRELDKLADRLKANVRQLDTTMGKMDDHIMVSRPSNNFFFFMVQWILQSVKKNSACVGVHMQVAAAVYKWVGI
jgi:hypothetical protein